MYSVLIVEDEPYLRQELVETVPWERHGFRVVAEAGTEEEAEALYQEHRPDLVVTDIRLPAGSGLDLLQRTSPRVAIVITGHDEFDYARRAIRLGVVDFLLKPIDDAELEGALRRCQLLLVGKPPLPDTAPASLITDDMENYDSRERHVVAAEDFIRRRYREDISLSAAASELGLSESYLSRIIRDLRNRTFVEMLTSYRLRAAVELLGDQRLRVGEIASLCGFRDQGYFARTFKRSFGLSPTLYRSRIQSVDGRVGKEGF
jgi:two-component system response regulator YesN